MAVAPQTVPLGVGLEARGLDELPELADRDVVLAHIKRLGDPHPMPGVLIDKRVGLEGDLVAAEYVDLLGDRVAIAHAELAGGNERQLELDGGGDLFFRNRAFGGRVHGWRGSRHGD